MQKQTRLMRRVKKILESKNNKFKRKYFLLSALASTNAKDSEAIMSEADCYANVLIQTNGQKPNEDCLIKLYENALDFSLIRDKESKIKFIKNYNDMLNSVKNNIEESIIDEELSLITGSNYKIDEKLYETLMTSIEKRNSILMDLNENQKRKERKAFFNIINSFRKVILESSPSDIDQIPFKSKITNKDLEKLGYEAPPHIPGQPKLSMVDVLASDAANVIENSTNVAKRKYYLIFKINFYLNIQQQLNRSKIEKQGKLDLTKSTDKFSNRPSGLTEDEVKTLRDKLDNMLKRHDNYESLDLDTDIIEEHELVGLLFKAAGDQRKEAVKDIEDMGRRFPLNQKEEEKIEKMSDEEEAEYLELQKQYDDKLADEDKEDFGEDYMSAEDAAKASQKEADKKSREEAERREKSGFISMYLNDAVKLLDTKKQETEEIKKVLDKISPDLSKSLEKENLTVSDFEKKIDQSKRILSEEDLELLEKFVEDLKSSEDTLYARIPNVSKSGLRNLAQSGDASALLQIVDQVDLEKPASLKDIAVIASHGETGSADAFKDSNAVRQSLMKSWFRALYFSFDDNKKSIVYATIANKWFKGLDKLDLIQDKAIKLPNVRSMAGTPFSKYYTLVKDIMTRENNIKKFITGEFELKNSDDEKAMQVNNIIDVNLTENTGFRTFATNLMKEYYSKKIWPSCETDIAYSIKEYFDKNYPSSNIGEGLQKGQKTRTIKAENGKTFFDTIVYAVMGRTGIKDSKGTLATPEQMIDQRKDAFRNKSKFLKRVADFNAEFPQNRLKSKIDSGSDFNEKDLDRLIDDMFDFDNGVIGSTFAKYRIMKDTDEVNRFVDWIESVSDEKIFARVSESVALSQLEDSKNKLEKLKDNPFLSPAERDNSKKKVIEDLKLYLKTYKDKLNVHRKNLDIADAIYVKYNGLVCDVMDFDEENQKVTIEDENGNEYIVSPNEVKLVD